MADIDFAGSAQKLARNPLGIIALFLVLVYGIAGLVFGLAAKNLTAGERQPLIWFLVIFPGLVLLLFGWLVAWHHTKLYAPADYRDAEGFFRALSPTEQRARIAAELDRIQSEATDVPKANDTRKSGTPGAEERESESIGDSQEQVSTEEPRTTASFVAQHRRELRAAVMLAEDLAFREIAAELGQPAVRQVGIGSNLQVDGVIRTPAKSIVVEVKYIRPTMAPAAFTHDVLARIALLAATLRSDRWRFLLAVVADGLSQAQRERLRKQLADRLNTSGVSADLRIFDFADLQNKFGVVPA